MSNRIILHIDMDAFFAAVEERNNPHLKGEPIVVGADPKGGTGRGVVSTANYEARRYGIHSAMPISEAYRRCPQAVFLPVDHKLYTNASNQIAIILQSMIVEALGTGRGRIEQGKIEQASIDEFYIDASEIGSWEKTIEFAKWIKKEIFGKEKLTCSVGIGPNKLIAKIASDFKKPDGLIVVRPEEVTAFLAPMNVAVIPGIGPKSATVLVEKGIKTVGDLRNIPREKLIELFGKWGSEMYDKARGTDDSPVGEPRETKSIGEQETFEKDTFDQAFLIERLMALCESVWRSLAEEKVRPKSVALMVRFADFKTVTRTKTKKSPIASAREFEQEALRLLLPFLDKRENPSQKRIRLLGVRGESLNR